jgi:hypothetical protein
MESMENAMILRLSFGYQEWYVEDNIMMICRWCRQTVLGCHGLWNHRIIGRALSSQDFDFPAFSFHRGRKRSIVEGG